MNIVAVLCYPRDRKVVREWLRQQEIREGFRGVQIATERFHMQGVNIEAFIIDEFDAPAELIEFAKSRLGRTPGLKPDFLTLDELKQRCGVRAHVKA